jgi:hypothetical protein
MRPQRRSLPALLAVAWAGLAAVACAGCLGAASAAPRVPHCAHPVAGAPVSPTSSARNVAVAYLSALGNHRYDSAQRYAHACSTGQQHSLDQLWLWLASMPTQQVRVTGAKVTATPGGMTVRATLYAKFGPAPYSAWVTLGPKTLRLGPVHGGWRVRADVSALDRSNLAAYGVSWLHHPYFINGERVTVVYAAPADVVDAQQILATADAVIPALASRYGGGEAGLRPVIFLIDNRSQGERLAHVDLGKVRTPAGFQYSSFTYIDLPAWRALPNIAQDSMVVHELTHVVTRPMLAGAPHSLLEGIAMYEEDAYLGRSGQTMGLDDVDAYYRQNAFPTLVVWRRRESDWGLPNVRAINLSYLDALAMTHAIMAENGGVPALSRLGAAFRAEHARRDFTAAQVKRAFRMALGVPFERVAAEAHAFANQVVAGGG